MRLSFKRSWKSITRSPSDAQLNDFIVLSGPNGSGKTSLLEAIARGDIEIEGIPFDPQNPTTSTNIRIFTLAQFIVPAEGGQSVNTFVGGWANLRNSVENFKSQWSQPPHNLTIGSDENYAQVRGQLIRENLITEHYLDVAEKSAKKRIDEFTSNDYRTHLSRIFTPHNAFELSINEIFLSYHTKRNMNQYNQFLVRDKGRTDLSPLSDEQFEKKYGPAPWKLFDETLEIVGLSNYKFVSPDGVEEDLLYLPSLKDDATGTVISVNDLSSGEKTLLAVAMTLYTGTNHADDIKLPRALLLDEADASLHPSMIDSLLKVVREILVEKFKIKVILTTHSPTTLALAPDDSLYTMIRDRNPRIKKAASKDEALKVVTVGLPTLSIKFDNRIQVFVEAEDDAVCYDSIYSLIAHEVGGEKSLSFIASGRGSNGNVNAVLYLVDKLNNAGNASIKGLIDRDTRTVAPPNIHFSSERYSLENHILDPLTMGIFLLRERFVSATKMGLPAGTTHLHAVGSGQRIIDFVIKEIQLTSDDATLQSVTYHGGNTHKLPRWILEINGHDLQTRYVSKFPKLTPLDRSKKLLQKVVKNAMYDVPSAIPKTIIDLFKDIAGA